MVGHDRPAWDTARVTSGESATGGRVGGGGGGRGLTYRALALLYPLVSAAEPIKSLHCRQGVPRKAFARVDGKPF